ncbi:nucleotidyltransferase [Leptospira selangorensis]|uniref:Nucleotidyltransferase n=2 Tax=Leptospira selangorensis TaxID=2484982 RepID=A0ABY2NG47_9LEPT|nr:nucleotidyltransferase [Leptospira selangorensis]
MTISEMFSNFLSNLSIKNSETISLRYGEITSVLNKTFRDTESKESNTLRVGSFGRNTGINGISDLDMLYIMPKTKWDEYNTNNGQQKILQEVKDAIKSRYPTTDIKVDRLVVTVTYKDFHIEVQPVFEQDDGSFKYPDTKNGGSWKITKPKEEMLEISEMDARKNFNLKPLAKMTRAWKNKHGIGIGGLVIDTLCYNFLSQTNEYDSKSFHYYDEFARDFFKYLSELPNQERYNAPGSNQHVKVKKNFQKQAKNAYNLCLKAIDSENNENVNEKWKKIFGRAFPESEKSISENLYKSESKWRNTEEFIEDKFPVDIRFNLEIDCDVQQDGFRVKSLREMIEERLPLLANKQLTFKIIKHNIPEPFTIYWKVLNQGSEAERRDNIRGEIVQDTGSFTKYEPTKFKGDHIVECYAVKSGIVVAKDRIDVPISNNG